MSPAALTREALLPPLAAHVLEHGLAGASLRPLAKAAGTSDRMLIYHFGSKDALVAALLEFIAARFAEVLDQALPPGRAATRAECVRSVLEVVGQPEYVPFFRLWWDIVAGCARGNADYLASAGKIMDELLGWLEARMPPGDPDPAGGARFLLTLIEGTQMLGAIGRQRIARAGLVASGL